MKDRTHQAIPPLVGLTTLAVFLPALRCGFVNWDDPMNLLDNPAFRGLSWRNIKWMFSTLYTGVYQPLSWVSLALDYRLWGLNPYGYHLTNVLIHSASAVLFYGVCRRLIAASVPQARAAETAAVAWCAGFAALLFSIHPLRVESVAWLTERRDVLSVFFYLATVLFYLRAVSSEGRNAERARWLGLSIFAYALSLLSKGLGITLPIVLLLLDVYPLRRFGRRIFVEKIPFFLLTLGAAAVGMSGDRSLGAAASLPEFGLMARAAQAAYGLSFYVLKTLAPSGLSPFYQLPEPFDPLSARFVLSGIFVLGCSLGFWRLRRRFPAGLCAWVFYAVSLSPVLGFMRFGGANQLVADRYSYISCMGWPILCGAGLLWTRKRSSGAARAGAFAGLTILLGLGGLTWSQEAVWRDSGTLWTRVLSVEPKNALAHNDLALFLQSRGRFKEAAEHFLLSAAYAPANAMPVVNLGILSEKQGNMDEAARSYRLALTLNPRAAQAHNNLATILFAKGRYEEALSHYKEAVRLAPDEASYRNNLNLVGKRSTAEAHNDLGVALAGKGEADEAIRQFTQALRPGYADAYNNLGLALAGKGKTNEAIRNYLLALQARPAFAEAHFNLGLALAEQGEIGEAARHFKLALQARPDYLDAYNGLGIALARQGKRTEAIAIFQQALAREPNYAPARRNLEVLSAGRRDAAR